MKSNDYLYYKNINSFLNKIIKILIREKKFKKVFLKYNPPLVFLAGPSLIKKMEKYFFNKDKEPDVLSFNWPENFKDGSSPKNPLGEIYLNKKLLKNEIRLKYVLVHGVLHLLGFNHDKKNDIIEMENKEKKILSQIN